jgi:hypothetical protein
MPNYISNFVNFNVLNAPIDISIFRVKEKNKIDDMIFMGQTLSTWWHVSGSKGFEIYITQQ